MKQSDTHFQHTDDLTGRTKQSDDSPSAPLRASSAAAHDGVVKKPLAGIRVIDLTKIVAGPNATRMLATMGAEVIRVEWHDQRALDLLRGVRPWAPSDDDESLNRSGLFNNINTGKRGVTLNMSLPQGRDIFKR